MPLLVVLAGALGAPARFVVERAVSRRTGWGWGTVTVNLLGSFLLGLLAGGAEAHGWSSDLRLVAGTGFLGAFTTFSAFTVECVRLPGRARATYLGVSVVGGLAAAAVGIALGTA